MTDTPGPLSVCSKTRGRTLTGNPLVSISWINHLHFSMACSYLPVCHNASLVVVKLDKLALSISNSDFTASIQSAISFPVAICYPAVRTGSSNTHFFSVVFFFWWSLAPDLRFSLGQRNTRRDFRYTAKGFYLE